MDRATATLFLVMLVFMGAIAYYLFTATPGAAGPNKLEVQVKPVEYTVSAYQIPVILKEGVGPNAGEKIAGSVYAYYTEVKDPYNIPSDAVLADSGDTNNGEITLTVTADPDYFSDKTGLKLWLVADSNDHYKGTETLDLPAKTTRDDRTYMVPNTVIKLDHVATMTWDADDAYRGTDSPVLRWKTNDELYKSIFAIKPSIDFETDRPSGVFLVKKVYLMEDTNADLTNVDSITMTVNDDTVFDSISPSDLPETYKYDQPMTVSADSPMNVTITVTTTDGTASLTSGSNLLKVKVEDVLGNTYELPVKVA